jgi:hypothetical protein
MIVVEGFVVFRCGCGVFVRGLRGLGEVAARAGAGVGEAGGEELLHRSAVEGQTVALAEFGVPGEAEPVEVFFHCGGELGAGTLGVEVFVAEVEQAASGAGAIVRDGEGAGVAEVEIAGRRGGETADVHKAVSRG